MYLYLIRASVVLIGLSLLGCSKTPGISPSRTPDDSYQPVLLAEDFPNASNWQNPFHFPDTSSRTYVYEGVTNEGNERIVLSRLSTTIVIINIECGILMEEVRVNGKMIERSYEYCAEDKLGNVWLLGVDAENYNTSGTLINRFGSWRAGEDDAKAGIKMPYNPIPGMTYRSEYYFNVAEDQAEILDIDVDMQIPFGQHTGCTVIREWSELEPEINEHKYYAPGIGLIKEFDPESGEQIILVEIQ